MSDYSIKTGDTWPPLTAVPSLSDGTLPNLTGATGVFQMMSTPRVHVLSGPATLDATANTASYQWGATDTTTAGVGEYLGEFVVTLASGKVERFPDEGYIDITIEASVGSRPPVFRPLIYDGSWSFDGSQQFNGIKVPPV